MSQSIPLDLQTQVVTALETSPYVAQRELQCEAEAGRVVLRGVVGSFYQKQMAQEALRGLEGVQVIENLLEVDWV